MLENIVSKEYMNFILSQKVTSDLYMGDICNYLSSNDLENKSNHDIIKSLDNENKLGEFVEYIDCYLKNTTYKKASILKKFYDSFLLGSASAFVTFFAAKEYFSSSFYESLAIGLSSGALIAAFYACSKTSNEITKEKYDAMKDLKSQIILYQTSKKAIEN